ncbi:MAG TPA: hypothetical protein VGC34_19200, partial [Steroidobacteraceae bacterium]
MFLIVSHCLGGESFAEGWCKKRGSFSRVVLGVIPEMGTVARCIDCVSLVCVAFDTGIFPAG